MGCVRGGLLLVQGTGNAIVTVPRRIVESMYVLVLCTAFADRQVVSMKLKRYGVSICPT